MISEGEDAPQRHTNAVNRSLSDIHTPTWMFLISLNSAVRASVFHPLQLALARKRVIQDKPSPSVWSLMAAAAKGGVRTIGPHSSSQVDFGPGGVRGLYRGYGAAFLSSLAGEATYLLALEKFKQKVVLHSEEKAERKRRKQAEILEGSGHASTDTRGTLQHERNVNLNHSEFYGHHWASAVSAIVADAVTTLCVTPIAVVVGRQMTSGVGLAANNPYRSIPGTVKHIWGLHQHKADEKLMQIASRSSSSFAGSCQPSMASPAQQRFWRTVYGMRGLYQGTTAAMLRVPSSGVWWGTYTAAKEGLYSYFSPILDRYRVEREMDGCAAKDAAVWKQNWLLSSTDNPLLNALSSAIASTITTIIVNPVAVIQIRLQSLPAAAVLENSKKTASAGVRARNTFLGVASNVYHKEGIRGFFRGTTTNVGIAIIDGIVFAIMFEFTKLGSDFGFMSQVKKDMNRSASGSEH